MRIGLCIVLRAVRRSFPSADPIMGRNKKTEPGLLLNRADVRWTCISMDGTRDPYASLWQSLVISFFRII
jgi:hypothetical protein